MRLVIQPSGRLATSDMPQEFETRRISPMEVFQHDESRTDRGEVGDEAPHLGKERGLAGDPFESTVGKRGRRRGHDGVVQSWHRVFPPESPACCRTTRPVCRRYRSGSEST